MDEENDTEDLTNCQICCEEYSLQDRIPRFLPCTHTVCEICIVQILSLSKDVLTCPECRKEHVISENEGVQAFHQNKYIVAHLRKQKQELISADACPRHNRPFSLFCEEEVCQRVICTRCLVEEHNAHSTSDLIEKAQNTKQLFKEEIAQMLDAIECNRKQRHQEAVYQFQKNHKSVAGLRERKTALIRMIENETDKLEREITDHCKEQVESLKECEKNLSVAMEKVTGLFCEFTKLSNSDVLKYKDVKRQLCQQIVHDVIKTSLSSNLNEYLELTAKHCDSVTAVKQLIGELTKSRPKVELGSYTSDIRMTNNICNCALCASEEVRFLTEGFITRLPDTEIHLSSSNLSNIKSTKGLEFNLDRWGFDPGESGAMAKRENVSMEVKSSGPETVYLNEYPAGDFIPKKQISNIKLVGQFADLCPDSVIKDGTEIKGEILRILPLLDGNLQMFGCYGASTSVQSKIFSDDQFLEEQLCERSSWRSRETVNCEEEVTIAEQRYIAMAELHPLRTHYVINFYPQNIGKKYCVDLPGLSVNYMCTLNPSTIIYAYTDTKSAELGNMVFHKVAFLQCEPVPNATGDGFVTNYTSLCAMCAMTHGARLLVLLCGGCIDLESPGVPFLTAYTEKGLALWKLGLDNPHNLCTDSIGNMFLATDNTVLLLDANGKFDRELLSERDGLGKGHVCLAFRREKSQLVVCHACTLRQTANIKGANGEYNHPAVINLYEITYK